MMREDLWRRALSRTGRTVRENYPRADQTVRENYPRGGCGFTADEEHEVKGLMRRVRDGVLTRACIRRDLRSVQQHLSRERGASEPDPVSIRELRSRFKVLNHVLDMTPDQALVSNPQLQVLGNGTDVMPERVEKALRKFHGTAPNGTLLRKYATDDGSDAVIDLGYLGDCPGVAWLSDASGSSDHDILVEKSHVRWNGFHRLFHGDQPRVDLIDDPSIHPDKQLACIVGGEIRKLKERCGENGVLGIAPIVEYTVERLPESTKSENHWCHQFDKDLEPILRWSDEVNGLVYERDRSLMGLTGVAPYRVRDWFER